MIKEKLAVFLGSKAMYITIASMLVGATAVTGTVVGVNQHNKHKSDFVETDTVITESVTDISTETELSLPSAEEVSAEASGVGNDKNNSTMNNNKKSVKPTYELTTFNNENAFSDEELQTITNGSNYFTMPETVTEQMQVVTCSKNNQEETSITAIFHTGGTTGGPIYTKDDL